MAATIYESQENAGGNLSPKLAAYRFPATNGATVEARAVVAVDPATGLPVGGDITKTNRSGTITIGGTAQQLMAANPSRRGWQLQNNSSGVLWFNETGSTAVANQPSFALYPGLMYESPVGAASTAAISIIGATTGQAFTAREW